LAPLQLLKKLSKITTTLKILAPLQLLKKLSKIITILAPPFLKVEKVEKVENK